MSSRFAWGRRLGRGVVGREWCGRRLYEPPLTAEGQSATTYGAGLMEGPTETVAWPDSGTLCRSFTFSIPSSLQTRLDDTHPCTAHEHRVRPPGLQNNQGQPRQTICDSGTNGQTVA
jgi:hypothetical protein